MNKVLVFNLFLCVSSLSFCSSNSFKVTDTRNNAVKEVVDKELELLWIWNETPLTMKYSSLDSRTCLEQSVATMLNSALDGWYGRALSNATSILVVIPRNSSDVTVLTGDDEEEGSVFGQKLQ